MATGPRMPKAFADVPARAAIHTKKDGQVIVRWGWKEWLAVLPLVREHLQSRGSEDLGPAIYLAQMRVLPKEHHRTRNALAVAVSAGLKGKAVDVVKLLRFIIDHESFIMRRVAAAPEAEKAEAPTTKKSKAQPPAEAPAATPPPVVALPVIDNEKLLRMSQAKDLPPLDALLAMPLGTLIRELFLSAARDVMTHSASAIQSQVELTLRDTVQSLRAELSSHASSLDTIVRAAVIDVVGAPIAAPAPTPAPAAPVLQADTTKPKPDPEPEPVVDESHAAANDVRAPSKVNGHNGHHVDEDPPPKGGRDLESQLLDVANRLGMDVGPVRKHVVAVGLHPRVQNEIERAFGTMHRFTFLRPDAFKAEKDIPASTDALLLCRKTLNGPLAQAVRRYAIPLQHVANDALAVRDALRLLFDEDAQPPVGFEDPRVTSERGHVPHRRH